MKIILRNIIISEKGKQADLDNCEPGTLNNWKNARKS